MRSLARSTPDLDRFKWMLPSCAALVVVFIYLSTALWAVDAEFFASVLFIAPALILASIALIIYALIRKGYRRRLTLLSTVAALWVTAVGMFFLAPKYDFALRSTARWLIWSRDYKAEVLAQPNSKIGDLKHIQWDSWGIVPAGFTTAYLVFDPSDSLSAAAKNEETGDFAGIPCPVPKVTRLEKNWYTVMFYTDQQWNDCDQKASAR